MKSSWPNVTAAAGDSVMLTCPLDTHNSCIIDFVEWCAGTGLDFFFFARKCGKSTRALNWCPPAGTSA